jgi:osmotically inducible protein OsmC
MADALYTAHAHVTGGRSGGHARTDDGRLEVGIEAPAELGGSGEGTNPEQLFAAGYAACFLSALTMPGVEREQAERLVETAHQVCPYSHATRGNIDVALSVG